MTRHQWPWIPFAFLAIAVGCYPLLYCFLDLAHQGLLQSKPRALVTTGWYLPAFYAHISGGGLALLIGWLQFSARLRARYPRLHRRIGTVYVVAVGLSSLAGCVLALFATGGWLAVTGFGALAVLWISTDVLAYLSIRRRDIVRHREWMIRNYALTFAAVTLRIYLPLSQVLHIPFLNAYPVIAWLCWVPNLFFAQKLIARPAA
jgi:uncharacterized membrane protein